MVKLRICEPVRITTQGGERGSVRYLVGLTGPQAMGHCAQKGKEQNAQTTATRAVRLQAREAEAAHGTTTGRQSVNNDRRLDNGKYADWVV